MRYGLKLVAGALLIVPLLVFGFAPRAAADTNDFTVTDFSADYTLTNADPQGELHVVEHIEVSFTDQNHGLLRAIPSTYKGQDVELHINSVASPSGAPVQYTTSQQNSNTIVRIGSPDTTITGAQSYTLDYTLHNVISFYNDHDELYWDINGDQWMQPFDRVSVTLHLPAAAKPWRDGPVCYTGDFGSTAQDCVVEQSGRTITARSLHTLPAGQTLTLVAGFAKGYFQPPSLWQKLSQHWRLLTGGVGLPLLVTLFSWLVWRKRGRDAKVRSVLVPEYGPPDNLSPLEAGTIMDFRVDNRDLTATIIDLAIRRYLKIIETKKDRLLGKDTLSYTLELTNADFSGLKPHETQLLTALFKDKTVGATASVASLENDLAATAKDIADAAERGLTARGYFRDNPLKSGKVLSVLAGICFFSVFFLLSILGPALAFGLAVSALAAWLFAKHMPARTAQGVQARNHLLGLKLYLEVAERDRLQKLQAPGAPYAPNADEPTKTVELFEKLLPYAMVLGVERQWARQFESLYTQPPDWYSGNFTVFNSYLLASSLNDALLPAVSQTFTAPSSSGGSGFSGGGGGGGGGGGW